MNLRNWVGLIVVGVMGCTALNAQEFKVTTSPNPVGPGGKLRLTVQSGASIDQANAVVAGVKIPLTKVSATVYTASIPVPATAKKGVVTGTIQFVSSRKPVAIPFQYEIGASPDRNPSSSRAGEGSRGVQLDTDPSDELTIKVDQLEAKVSSLQTQRNALKSKVQTLSNEVAQLKKQNQPSGKIQTKQRELDALQSELDSRQRDLEKKSSEFAEQLNQLNARQAQLDVRENEVKAIEQKIENEKKALATQTIQTQAEAQRVMAKEKEIQARESDMAKAAKDLADKGHQLTAQVSQLRDQQVELNQKKMESDQRRRELEALQLKLGNKSNEVQSLAKQLDEDRVEIAKQQASIASQASSVSARERELKAEELLMRSRQDRLQSDTETLVKEQQAVNELQERVRQRQEKLSTQEQQLNQVRGELDQREKQIQSRGAELDTQERDVASKKAAIQRREQQLSAMTTDLDNRSQQLALLNTEFDANRRKYANDRAQLMADQESIANDRARLSADKESLTQANAAIQSLGNELAVKRAQFEKEYTEKTAAQSSDRLALERRRNEIEAATARLTQMKSDAAAQAAVQTRRQAEIDAASAVLANQVKSMDRREKSLTQSERDIKTLQADVEAKYRAIDDLKNWIQRRSAEVEKSYQVAADTNLVDETTFDLQFQRIEAMTRTLQERSQKIKSINQALIDRNTALENEMIAVVSTRNQFNINFAVGYHNFDGSVPYQSSAQFGLHFNGQFNREWNGEVGGVLIPSIDDGRSRTIIQFDGTVRKGLMQFGNTDIVGSLGVVAEVARAATIMPIIGIGTKWRLSNDFSTTIELSKSRDVLLNLGFEKRLILDAPAKPTQRVIGAISPQSDTPTVSSVPTINCILTLNSDRRIRYSFVGHDLVDIDTHWAKNQLELSDRYRLLMPEAVTTSTSGNGPSPLKWAMAPNKPLTLIEAARMISLAMVLPKKIRQQTTSLSYTIVDIPGTRYFTDVVIRNPKNEIVRVLQNKFRTTAGEHSVLWDGRDDLKRDVEPGTYTVEVTLYNGDRVKVGGRSVPVGVEGNESITYRSKSKNVRFDDVPTDSESQQYVNDWIGLGNSIDSIRKTTTRSTRPSHKFGPARSVSRISFMVAISNAIKVSAGNNYVVPDLSPYRDIKTISPTTKAQLGLYISELNYGGDDQNRLRPFEDITRAEAAAIVGRFLNWLSIREGVTL